MRWAAALGLAIVLAGATAGAHTRSQSFSTWRVDGGRVSATWSLLAREVTRLPEAATGRPLPDVFARHLDASVRVSRGGAPCAPEAPARPRRARSGHVRVELVFACPAEGPLAIESDALFERAPSHVHFARVSDAEGRPVEHLLTDAVRQRVLIGSGAPAEERPGAGFASYLALGTRHILSGADHIAFLLSLLLLGGRLRDVLLVVTGFTLGHSLTLSLAVLGWVRVDGGLVEALIGFSIALVAAENLGVRAGDNPALGRLAGSMLAALALLAAWGGFGPPWLALAGLALFTFCYLSLAGSERDAQRFRPAITVLFGLVHGFGFASMLLEIGLPPGRVAVGLLGFNLGVELGQIGLVLLWLAALRTTSALLPERSAPLAADALSASLLALGVYWFATRGWA